MYGQISTWIAKQISRWIAKKIEGILDYDIVDPETLLMKRKKAKQSPNMIKALMDRSYTKLA